MPTSKSAVVNAAVGCGEAGGEERGEGGEKMHRPFGIRAFFLEDGVVIFASSDPPIWWPCLYCPVSGVPDMEVSTYSSILHAGLDGVRNLPGRSGAFVVRGWCRLPWVAPLSSGGTRAFLECRIFLSSRPVINHLICYPKSGYPVVVRLLPGRAGLGGGQGYDTAEMRYPAGWLVGRGGPPGRVYGLVAWAGCSVW